MVVISRTRIFFKAHRDQNSTSMISIEVVASLSQQQTVASNLESKMLAVRGVIILNLVCDDCNIQVRLMRYFVGRWAFS